MRGRFFFTRTMLFPPLDKKNTRDKAKGFVSLRRGISGSWAHDALALSIEVRTRGNSLYIGL